MDGVKLESNPYSDLIAISDDVLAAVASKESIDSVNEFLSAVAETAHQFNWGNLHDAAFLYAALVQLLTCSRDDVVLSSEESDEISTAIVNGVSEMRLAMSYGPDADGDMKRTADLAKERWGAYIELLDDPRDTCHLDPAVADTQNETSGEVVPSEDDVSRILSAVSDIEQPVREDGGTTEKRAEPQAGPADALTVPPMLIDNAELAEAFLDDAGKCVAAMEDAVLEFEHDLTNHEPLRQLCRELHTLKGASGSVGLSELSDYLHHVEDDIQSCCDGNVPAPDVDAILQCVDTVRKQMAFLRPAASAPDDLPANQSAARPISNSAPSPNFDESVQDAGHSIRIKAAQLDRLMDMLSELVMLRNERGSSLEKLKKCYGELVGCVPRIRASNTVIPQPTVHPADEPQNPEVSSGSFKEVADDVAELAYSLREAIEPLVTENSAISRIIGQFRQELVELRRVPIDGLFHRLQRSVRDAARAEGKTVQLKMIGEQAGIDRSLQERVYEPLLHIVRNAVSHGIEDATERAAAGKEATGTVELEARSGANFLVIEVRDDGKGLDYDALRRRGTELGLLQSDHPATRDELAQLIFHPGFSTVNNATEISGRGVGMDVVATALERMRSWIELESTPGVGTTVRMTFPLPSVIEHVMRFRSDGQLFAVPMKFVHFSGQFNNDETAEQEAVDHTVSVPFDELFATQPNVSKSAEARIVIGYQDVNNSDDDQSHWVALTVDEIVGPDEVVMRPMPPLLKHDTLYAGVTLAGTGEIVLVFDALRLIERSQSVAAEENDLPIALKPRKPKKSSEPRPRALVVDDSVSARRAMSNMLERQGFECTEAADGLEATEHLRNSSFNMVVSDLEMPRVGGLELLERIRANPSLVNLPVIMASSRDDEEFQSRARELGALAYLIKPVDENKLAETLAACPQCRIKP